MKVSFGLLVQWIIIAGLLIYFGIVGARIKDNPRGHQNFWEMIVEKMQGFIKNNMGEEFLFLSEYFLVLTVFLLTCNLTGLFGIKNPSTDYSFCVALGLMNFILIQYCAVKKNGLVGYFKGYLKPMPVILPLNIMERLLFPVSLSLRLFGNMFAAYMIIELLYKGLTHLSPILGIGIPIPMHMYFDIFDGTLQTLILVLLSMINLKIISKH